MRPGRKARPSAWTIALAHDTSAATATGTAPRPRTSSRQAATAVPALTASIAAQHYAFLVGEEEFGAAFGRIRDQGLTYWADPGRRQRGVINHRDGGRGLYFEDPDGHLLEILTRPYGSGG